MHGYLHNKKADEIMRQLNVLLDLAPEDVLKASRFLLEINFSELSTSNLETQKYWTLMVDAALKAKALESAREGHEPNRSGGNSIHRFLAEQHSDHRATNLQRWHAQGNSPY
jgi:hypothetical protein